LENRKVVIIGAGNIGSSIAFGINESKLIETNNIIVTRRSEEGLKKFSEMGMTTTTDNKKAVEWADIVVIAVTPKELNGLLDEISPYLVENKHEIISIVSGASIKDMKSRITKNIPVIRAMPNTAVAIRESMTCLCGDNSDKVALDNAVKLFEPLGAAIVIREDLMVPATALCACGIAFFLRAVRAASQGGIEIGFHAEDALFMAAQTAKGAASLLLKKGTHPEGEVDKVTTPRGCTIAGLNQMEHSGFSSSLIKGIVISAEKAEKLYS
jgi:pyrroline-5-carboxylate reductase